ncbi:uncharacterized protein [Amphiura filiformis]|uniref:uncharacterized protein n=1 Tax=Amphiura filiformis TaxID=82378 RepID=UPI003B228DBB
MEALRDESHRLVRASVASSTWASYRKGIENFIDFREKFNLGSSWPANQSHIVAFISFLSSEGWAPSSINSNISAIAFVHNINGWLDPTCSFLIKKLKEGCRRLNPRVDSRLPITPPILNKLVQHLPSICSSSYEAQLFKAAFLLAFFGFLRVGELTCQRKQGIFSRVILKQDIGARYKSKSQGIKLIGLDPEYFSPHSFRIGAATAAAMGGINDEKIKEMGRWKSSAFRLYIRPINMCNNL